MYTREKGVFRCVADVVVVISHQPLLSQAPSSLPYYLVRGHRKDFGLAVSVVTLVKAPPS